VFLFFDPLLFIFLLSLTNTNHVTTFHVRETASPTFFTDCAVHYTDHFDLPGSLSDLGRFTRQVDIANQSIDQYSFITTRANATKQPNKTNKLHAICCAEQSKNEKKI